MSTKALLKQSLAQVRVAKATEPKDEPKRIIKPVLEIQRHLETHKAVARLKMQPVDIIDSGINSRFDVTERIEKLKSSIKRSGQSVPISVRRANHTSEQYEIVYGRRRIEACRQLGINVLAYIIDVNDRDVLISQNLENAARLDISFIEKALYAKRLEDHGFTHKEIRNLLAVKRSALSRMFNVTSKLPRLVIDAIGPAHGHGSRQWELLCKAISDRFDLDEEDILAQIDSCLPSAERLCALLNKLVPSLQSKTKKKPLRRILADGQISMKSHSGRITIRTRGEMVGFSEFVDQRLEALWVGYQASASPPLA